MHIPPPALLIMLALAASGVAQDNEFMIYPERNGTAATYTTRTANTVVEQFMEASGSLFAGIGDRTTQCEANGIYHWATDEDATSQEIYHVLIRRATGGQLDTSASGILTRVGPLSLPTGNGRLGWRMTDRFATPVVIPATTGVFFGVELDADNWTADGHSIWCAWYTSPANRPVGENPRANAPVHAWAFDGTNVNSFPYSFRVGLLVAASVLNIGGIDPNNTRQLPVGSPNYGAGGLYPDISGAPRSDGLNLRVEELRFTGAAYAYLSAPALGPGIPIPPIQGRLWLDPLTLLPVGSAVLSGGVATIPVVAPNTLPPTLFGAVFFQAVVVGPGGAGFTNLQGVAF